MVLSNKNVEEAMASQKIGSIAEAELKAALEKIMRDTYVLAGLDPQLGYEQMSELAHDLRAGQPHLTLNEIRLACKAGVSGELGGPKRPCYAAVMQWSEAYDKCAMVTDVRKYLRNRPKETPRITEEEGLQLMAGLMPMNTRRRWEEIRTNGAFSKALIPHVSAQIYDWLGEEGVLRLSPEDRTASMAKARKEVREDAGWDLESGEQQIRSRAKHYALQTWMQRIYETGKALTLPKMTRIYQ